MKRIYTLLLLLLPLVGFAQNLTVESPRVVAVGETFRIVFTADARMTDFEWECPSQFVVMWGPQKGSMSSTSIVNGKRTSTHQETVTYLLEASEEGKYQIPAATAKVGGQSTATRGFTVEVVKAEDRQDSRSQDQSGNNQSQQSQQSRSAQSQSFDGNSSSTDIFLRLTVNKTSAVKGEPISAVLKIYTRADIANFEDVHFPSFDGFWSREVETPQNIEFTRESVNGTIYNSALLRRYMLIPQKSGSLSIQPAELTCLLRVRSSSSGRSIFDDFFDSYQTVRKKIATPAVKINVRELPAGAPASFKGGVGDFTMTTSFSKDNLKSNEASSFIITVTGKGNISMIEAPDVEFPSDFEVYDIKTSENVSADGTSGTKTFEYPFIPRSYGDFKFGPVEYGYYNLARGSYSTLNSGEISVSVEKGEGVVDGGVIMPGVTRKSVQNIADDIRFIRTGNAGLREKGHFFVKSSAWWLALVAVALFFALSHLMRSMAARRKDIAGTRNRKANKMARARLRLAGDYLKQNLSTAFYEEMHKALLGYVSDKLAIPVADLSKERISEKFASAGVDDAMASSFLSLVDACEFARYSPDSVVTQMEGQYEDAVRIISELEGTMKNRTVSQKKSAGVAVTLIMLTLSMTSLHAQQKYDDMWSAGNDAYSADDYQSAIKNYSAIVEGGLVSADLYYNMGNAYYKMGDLPHSILYYERALKLNPSHSDAKANLDVLHLSVLDKIEPVPEFILFTWIENLRNSFSSDAWAVIAVVLLFVASFLFVLFRFAGTVSKARLFFVSACAAVVISVASLLFSLSIMRNSNSEDAAVVMNPVASVKSSPSDDGKSIFVLHEGTKISILDALSGWKKIELSDGRQGWIPDSAIEII